MKNSNLKIFIEKYSFKKGEEYDLSFLNMLIRRKLSPLSKIAFASLYECFENKNVRLIFASQYSEYKKLLQLSKQYKEENSVSPIGFSTSVHNASIGTFSLLNEIKNTYISLGAAENTFHAGLLDAVLNAQEEDSLYCYADYGVSFSCLLKTHSDKDSLKLELVQNEKPDSIEDFEKFLLNKKNEFLGNNYILKR